MHGVITAIRSASKLMGEGGRIVTIGSDIATRASFPGLADYAATKAAVVGYTKGASRDLGPRGITVNVLQPGSINTDMNPDDDREFAEAQRTQHALQRFGTAEEIAAGVVFLTSPEASFVTGTVLKSMAVLAPDPDNRARCARRPLKIQNEKEYPMIELRPFAKLGGADHGWLKAKHHFSFGGHYDPENMGHGSLRVWNDDEIAPNSGFPAHPHANMEIITYVREGAITHQDSLGNKGRTEAGDVQVMSAGSGIRHSEYNLEPSKTKIFQIWIEPTTKGGQPTWGAKPFPKSDRSGKLVTIASGIAGDKDALPIRADARVLATTLKAGESAEYTPEKTRNLYLVPAAGSVEVNGIRVNARDGAAIRGEARLRITALEDSELVLVDAA